MMRLAVGLTKTCSVQIVSTLTVALFIVIVIILFLLIATCYIGVSDTSILAGPSIKYSLSAQGLNCSEVGPYKLMIG